MIDDALTPNGTFHLQNVSSFQIIYRWQLRCQHSLAMGFTVLHAKLSAILLT